MVIFVTVRQIPLLLNAFSITALAIGGLVLLGAVFAWVAVRSFRNLIQRLGQSVPGLLIDALKKDISSGEYARRMQEPVSLSGMDRLLAPQIQADFPELNLDEQKARAERLTRSTLEAIDAQDPARLAEHSTLYDAQVRHYLENLGDAGQRERFSGITVHRTVISDYQKQAGTCRIRFQMAVGANYAKMDRSGAIVAGHDGVTQFKAELELLYVQDRNQLPSPSIEALAFNCPNCGAPVPKLGEKTCAYCGSTIEPLNIRVWTFSGFTLSGFKSGAYLPSFLTMP